MQAPPIEVATAELLPPHIGSRVEKRDYESRKTLGQQMGVYFYELCKLRTAMGRKHVTDLLNEIRQERMKRLKKLRETRNDKRKDPAGKGGGRVRSDRAR